VRVVVALARVVAVTARALFLAPSSAPARNHPLARANADEWRPLPSAWAAVSRARRRVG